MRVETSFNRKTPATEIACNFELNCTQESLHIECTMKTDDGNLHEMVKLESSWKFSIKNSRNRMKWFCDDMHVWLRNFQNISKLILALSPFNRDNKFVPKFIGKYDYVVEIFLCSTYFRMLYCNFLIFERHFCESFQFNIRVATFSGCCWCQRTIETGFCS